MTDPGGEGGSRAVGRGGEREERERSRKGGERKRDTEEEREGERERREERGGDTMRERGRETDNISKVLDNETSS